jgi:hypothetical protein
MADDPLEQWQQQLMASLDRALVRSAHADPLLYARLRGLRERLVANLTAAPPATDEPMTRERADQAKQPSSRTAERVSAGRA